MTSTHYPSKRCDTGACVRAETDGASTRIWESAQLGIEVVTSTESWQALLQEQRDEERARIVAWLRNLDDMGTAYPDDFADLLERGDDLAAGDE